MDIKFVRHIEVTLEDDEVNQLFRLLKYECEGEQTIDKTTAEMYDKLKVALTSSH